MKRLPALPKDVRSAWRPKTRLPSTAGVATPEENKSKHWIHDWETADKADLDLGEVTFHRGKARASKANETKVFVMAVWRRHVIAYTSSTIMRSYAEPNDPYRAHRQAKIAETENSIADHLRQSLARTVAKAKEDLEAEKHAALPTTKLAALRRRIASLESVLAELRVEESELVAQEADQTS